MGKDKSLFANISSEFTEDTLKKILQKITGKKEVTIEGWEFERGSEKGDNYSGVIYRVTIDGFVDGKNIKAKVIAKSLPRNEAALEIFGTSGFTNEYNFYTKVIPKLEKFLASKNLEEILLPVPQCLEAYCDGKNDFLVLRDLRELGYSHRTRQNVLSLTDIQLVLETLAKFHALSFAYRDQHPSEFSEIGNRLRETYFCEDNWSWYGMLFSSVVSAGKDALSKEYPGTPEEKHFSSIDPWELFQKGIPYSHNPSAPTSTITHGDAWQSNIMFRENDITHETEAILLDFEITRCSSPVTDISYFLYSCSSKEMLDKNYDNLLKYYYEQLSKFIELLGSDPMKIYPWDVFMQEVKEHSIAGFCIALDGLCLLLVDSADALGKEDLSGSETEDLSELFKIPPFEDKEKRRRIADVIIHAIHHGFI